MPKRQRASVTIAVVFLSISAYGQTASRPTTTRPAASRPATSRPAKRATPEEKWLAAFNKIRTEKESRWKDRSAYSLKQEARRCREWSKVSKAKYDKAYWNAAARWLNDMSQEPGRVAKSKNDTELEKRKNENNGKRIMDFVRVNKELRGCEHHTFKEAETHAAYEPTSFHYSAILPILQKMDSAYAREIEDDDTARDLKRQEKYELDKEEYIKRNQPIRIR